MSEIKACKDCDYYSSELLFPKCHRPLESSFWYFDAKYRNEKNDKWVETERMSFDNYCGKEAKYFMPRRPWWKRLLRIK